MMLYAVRKRRGQWTICSDENVLLNFNSYDEAIETARSAVVVLSKRETSCQNLTARIGGRAWRLPRRTWPHRLDGLNEEMEAANAGMKEAANW